MPERTPRRLLAAAAVAAIAVAVAAPGALAQSDEVPEAEEPTWEERWETSALDAPWDQPGHVVRVQPFTVGGTLRYEKVGPADHITQAEIRVVDDPSDDREPGEGCELPEPVVIAGPGPQPELFAELSFFVEVGEVTCNGAHLLEVEATLDDPEAPTYVLSQAFVVGMLPPAVTDLSVQLDEPARTATVTFSPLTDDQLAPDAVGYVLERGGPASGSSGGRFVDVGTLGLDDEPGFVDDLGDAAGGAYTYRVRAMRAGAGEPERSSVIDTDTATITIGDPPAGTSTTVAERPGPRRGGVSIARRSSAPTRPRTVTTIDTGFEDTLDYGERPPGSSTTDLPGDEPLAGQSIIQDEGEDVDLAAPVAGALVLLGWAGHIAYLNRLARQL